jgi:CDP-diacylglycerol--glycerol-3-phosphate 3-phosphatidyltransferase
VGATANVGIAERAERLIVVLLAALLAGLGVPYVLPIALGILAVLSVVTVVQRIVVVRRQLKAPREAAE